MKTQTRGRRGANGPSALDPSSRAGWERPLAGRMISAAGHRSCGLTLDQRCLRDAPRACSVRGRTASGFRSKGSAKRNAGGVCDERTSRRRARGVGQGAVHGDPDPGRDPQLFSSNVPPSSTTKNDESEAADPTVESTTAFAAPDRKWCTSLRGTEREREPSNGCDERVKGENRTTFGRGRRSEVKGGDAELLLRQGGNLRMQPQAKRTPPALTDRESGQSRLDLELVVASPSGRVRGLPSGGR